MLFYLYIHFIYTFTYVNEEVGGPNLSQEHDWSNRRARQKQTIPDPKPRSL